MIGKALELLLIEENLKLKELSSILDISYSTLSNYKNDISDPDIKTLRIIRQKYFEEKNKKINLDWLATLEGDMFISEKLDMNSPEFTAEFDRLVQESGCYFDKDGILRKRI